MAFSSIISQVRLTFTECYLLCYLIPPLSQMSLHAHYEILKLKKTTVLQCQGKK